MLKAYTHALIDMVSSEVEHTSNSRDLALWSTFYPIIYQAGATSLFGTTFPSSRTIDSFVLFDTAVPLIVGRLPQFMWKPAARARDDLVNTIDQWLAEREAKQQGMEDTAPFIQALFSIFTERGWSRKEFALTSMQELWVRCLRYSHNTGGWPNSLLSFIQALEVSHEARPNVLHADLAEGQLISCRHLDACFHYP